LDTVMAAVVFGEQLAVLGVHVGYSADRGH
jgi:hypothetical protein